MVTVLFAIIKLKDKTVCRTIWPGLIEHQLPKSIKIKLLTRIFSQYAQEDVCWHETENWQLLGSFGPQIDPDLRSFRNSQLFRVNISSTRRRCPICNQCCFDAVQTKTGAGRGPVAGPRAKEGTQKVHAVTRCQFFSPRTPVKSVY